MNSMKDCYELENGVKIPCMGYGTYKAAEGNNEGIIKTAIEAGYRYFDTASFYDTEEALGRKRVLEHPLLGGLAEKYNKSAAQICLRYEIQRQVIPLPKASTKERMVQNYQVFDFEIEKEDMYRIDSMQPAGWSGEHPDFPREKKGIFKKHRMGEQTKTWNKYIHKVQNYETDQMGIVHHSNYIRWFEEARCDLLDYMGVGFADLEKQGIISPILSVEADYLRMVYYGDTVSIDAYIKEYNGIKLTVGYEVKDDRTGMVHCRGTSKHCFIDKTGRPLVLRKSFPELNEAFEAGVKIHKENKKALIKKREDK